MSVFDKDWFQRRSNYVVKDESNSIGWDSSLTSEYSKYLYSSSKATGLCAKPELLVPEFREIMNSVNVKKDTECYINTKDDSSYTDGKKIFVSAECLKDEDLSCFTKLDIMIGLLLHESAHCLFSNFSNLVEVTDNLSYFRKEIQNILEDEAIEEKLCNRWPGNANFISIVKEKYFGKAIDDITANKPKNFVDEIFSILLLAIRYPNKLSEYVSKSSDKTKIEEIFGKIYEAAYFSGYLKTSSNYDVTKKTKELSAEILNIILEYIDEKEFKSQVEECTSPNNNSGNNNESKSSMKIYEEAAEKLENAAEAKDESERNELAKKFKKIESNKLNSEIKTINRDITSVNMKLKDSSFIHSANEAEYKRIFNDVISYSKILRKKILLNKTKDKLMTLNNMRSGSLNPSKLAEAYQGVEHTYDKHILKRDKIELARYALVLVLDESGSMIRYKNIIEHIAIMLYEAFANQHEIELFVFGHGDKVNVYIDKRHKDKFVLANTEQQMEQNEGKSYKYILSHVHSQTKLNAVIISLTDSYYCFNEEEFSSVLNEYRDKYKDSFNLIKLGSTEYDSEESDDVNKKNDELYGENCWIRLNCRDFDEIMPQIVNTLTPILIKNYSKSEKLHR